MITEPIIDESYFDKSPTYINLSGVGAEDKLRENIITYQNKILISFLGYPLYRELSESIENGIEEKWDKFLNGELYDYNDIKYDYQGFKDILKYFIYFYHRRQEQITKTTLGDVKARMENSMIQSINADVVRIYNMGVELYGCNGICSQYEDYKPTAYNYLCHKRESFNNWQFTPIKTINNFGI